MADQTQTVPTHTKDNPFLSAVTENRILNMPGSQKDTRHVVVDIAGSGLEYETGDSLGVFPSNSEKAVAEVLSALGAEGDESVTPPKHDQAMSLRDALSHHLNIAVQNKKFLQAMAAKTGDAREKEKLEALLQPEARQEMMSFLANREVVDLLEEFPGTRFSPQELVDNLKRLVPRLYSIASSPELFPNEVHMTVAVVRYRTNDRERIGVCSTYLAERAPLHQREVPVFLAKSHFRLPEDASRDIIMVGPGTGIAPFRAFLQERIALGAPGRNWLFFGDQRRDYDYLYGEEFDEELAAGKLHRLSLAFSRDQEKKIYVQDRMLEEARTLWEWIDNGAYFYVCGDAQRMAKDVDQALHRIARECGGLSEEEAASYIKLMRKERRYQRDVY